MPEKIVKRSVVALGIVCIILVAGIGGVVTYYTIQINNRDNQIASTTEIVDQLNARITDQNKVINQLNGTIANQNSALTSLNAQTTNLTDELNQLQTWLNETITLLNQTQTPSAAQGVYDGFQLTITLQKTLYELGNPINISFTLTNISNQTVTFWLDYSFSYFQFFVYNSTMNEIYSPLWGILEPLAVSYTLDAGQSMSDSNSWGQTWNNTMFSPEGIPVLPGTYYIVGQVGPMYYGTNSTIETTPIRITILPF